jgi:hypothetical protein
VPPCRSDACTVHCAALSLPSGEVVQGVALSITPGRVVHCAALSVPSGDTRDPIQFWEQPGGPSGAGPKPASEARGAGCSISVVFPGDGGGAARDRGATAARPSPAAPNLCRLRPPSSLTPTSLAPVLLAPRAPSRAWYARGGGAPGNPGRPRRAGGERRVTGSARGGRQRSVTGEDQGTDRNLMFASVAARIVASGSRRERANASFPSVRAGAIFLSHRPFPWLSLRSTFARRPLTARHSLPLVPTSLRPTLIQNLPLVLLLLGVNDFVIGVDLRSYSLRLA